LVDLDLGPAHRSRLTAASELSYFIYLRRLEVPPEIGGARCPVSGCWPSCWDSYGVV